MQKISKYKKVDSGGKVLNSLGFLVEDKLKFMRKYKFSIAFENESFPGYTTEKILEAFYSNTIPIYWGNPLIEEEFNSKSFINCHAFKDFNEVVEKIIEIDNDDNLFKSYLETFPLKSKTECFKN